MKGRSLLYWALLLLGGSCVQENEEIGNTDPVIIARSVTLAAETDGVEVLIFGRNDTDFTYLKSISGGWNDKGERSVSLEVGDYKFLFYKSDLVNTRLLPDPLTQVKTEAIKISVREDEEHVGYHLPADEVFLPLTPEMADKLYEIRGEDTVRNTLTRAVGQIVLELKRGASESGKTDSLPYPPGKTIMDNIEKVILDVSNVGEAVNPAGGIGSTRTLWTNTTPSSITESGFAHFEGPFVFPSGTGGETIIKVTLVPKSGSPFPEMSQTVAGMIERNKKLVVTLWLTSTYRFIGITVKTDPISETKKGDEGIWE